MYKALENSLFEKDRSRYYSIQKCVTQFNSVYNGNNIIQDDIFHIMENYVNRHGMPFELLRYPIADQEFCVRVRLFGNSACLYWLIQQFLWLNRFLLLPMNYITYIAFQMKTIQIFLSGDPF